MARKVNTSKERRRSKRKDRVDYTSRTAAGLRVLEQVALAEARGMAQLANFFEGVRDVIQKPTKNRD